MSVRSVRFCFLSAIAFLLPSLAAAIEVARLSAAFFRSAAVIGGVGNLAFPSIPLMIVVTRVMNASSVNRVNPSCGRTALGFVVVWFVDIGSPMLLLWEGLFTGRRSQAGRRAAVLLPANLY